ncbi:MAG: hypothetical protein ACREVG_02460, partial [Burkholderiales bacterium]
RLGQSLSTAPSAHSSGAAVAVVSVKSAMRMKNGPERATAEHKSLATSAVHADFAHQYAFSVNKSDLP